MREEAFAFVDAGRTFRCQVAPVHARSADAWWWFEVSTEAHQRHAPFRAEPGDTQESVQARMVAYYDNLLALRAAPPQTRWNRRPTAPAAAEGAPASGEAARP